MNSTFSRFCIHRAESPIVAASGCPSTSFSPAPSAAVSRFRASKILRLGLTINVEKQLGLALLHTTVVAPDGKKIEGDMGRGTVRTKKKLNRSGRYEVWIGGGISQGVGIYRVQFKFEVS